MVVVSGSNEIPSIRFENVFRIKNVTSSCFPIHISHFNTQVGRKHFHQATVFGGFLVLEYNATRIASIQPCENTNRKPGIEFSGISQFNVALFVTSEEEGTVWISKRTWFKSDVTRDGLCASTWTFVDSSVDTIQGKQSQGVRYS